MQCPGCKAEFPEMEGPIWQYGVTSPGCWQAYTTLLGYERDTLGFPEENRLIVDAYAIQHPQNLELQRSLGITQRLIDASIQSVAVHLIALYAAFEKGIPLTQITPLIARILTQKPQFEILEPPETLGSLTVKDFSTSMTKQEYQAFAYAWAQSAWQAWNIHHAKVKSWYDTYVANRY